MGTPSFTVIHLDTGVTWRGGQQQVAWLHQGLTERGVPSLVVCPPLSPLGDWCRTRRLPWYGMHLGGEWNAAAGLRLALLCRGHRAHILHAHTSHALGLALWASLVVPAVRIVVTRRLDFHVGRNLLSRWKYSTRRVAAIVCVSEGVRRVLLSDGVPEKKLTVIHDGVDPTRFELCNSAASPLSELPPGTVVIGTVAALVGHKDYPTLLRAAAEVLGRRANVVFCALGDGAQRETLKTLHRRLGLGERFIFAGFRTDIGPWLRRFDMFVLASREEGLGSSVLDAQALGIPVVATRAGGIPEVVEDGVSGLLVPVGDPTALASALLRLIDSPQARKALGDAGRAVARRFSYTVMVDRHIELYRSVVAR